MGNRVDYSRHDVPLFERFALGTGEESKWFEIRLPAGTRRLALKCDADFYVRSEQRRVDGSFDGSIAGTAISTSSRTVGANGAPTGGDPYCLLPAATTEDMFHEWSMGPARVGWSSAGGTGCGKVASSRTWSAGFEGERPPILYVASATASAEFQLFAQGEDISAQQLLRELKAGRL